MIVHKASGNCLSVPNSYSNGNAVVLQPCSTTSKWHRWYVAPVFSTVSFSTGATGYYKILSMGSGKVIDVDTGSLQANAWDYHSGTNQQVKIISTSTTTPKLGVNIQLQYNNYYFVNASANIKVTAATSSHSQFNLVAV